MGGSISLYALLTRPDGFGFCGISAVYGGWIYMNVGNNETPEVPGRKEAYLNDAIAMEALLRAKGYRADDLHFIVEEGGAHYESA